MNLSWMGFYVFAKDSDRSAVFNAVDAAATLQAIQLPRTNAEEKSPSV